MRSFLENKRLVLLLAVLALGALTVLAVSLNEVPFREGQQFGHREAVDVQVSAQQVAQVWGNIPVWKHMVVWLLASLMIVLIGLLLSPELRKRLFVLFIRVVFTVWAVYFFLRNFGDRILGLNLQGAAAQPSDNSNAPLPVFEPPQVSPTFSYLISFVVALLWLVLLWALYRGWQKYSALLSSKTPLEELARIARSSLDDLSNGRNSSDVIINCYLRMSDIVADKRRLYRHEAMTPSEFAVRLEQAGLPGDAVRRLTHLFEGVRYGDRRSGPKDVNEAVSCLKTILHYCGEPV
jgi:hypothetical protein